MPRKCTACGSLSREHIDKLLIEGKEALREISIKFDVSIPALDRHRKNHIQPLVTQAIEKINGRVRKTAAEVIARWEAHAFPDIKGMFNNWGAFKDVAELTEEQAAMIVGFEVGEIYEGEGDQKQVVGGIKKVRLEPRLGYHKMLGQHHGLLPSAPAPPTTQNNLQINFYSHTREDLEYFIQNGKFPDDTDQGPGGPSTEIVRSGSTEALERG